MRVKTILKYSLLFLSLPGLLTSCTGANLYKDASTKTTDEAYYDDAQKKLDAGDYTGAIADLTATSATYQAQTNVKESLAGAYAARCGMVFIPFVTSFTGSSSSSFLIMTMKTFVGIDTSKVSDCLQAKTIIQSIGNFAQRTNSENLFLAVLAIALMGNRLRNDADTSPAPYGDGNVDAGFNCGPTHFPIADAAILIESFSLLLENLAALTTAIGTGSTSSLSSVATACGSTCTTVTYAGASPAETDAAIITARAMVNMQSIGLGSCNNANPAACACAFP